MLEDPRSPLSAPSTKTYNIDSQRAQSRCDNECKQKWHLTFDKFEKDKVQLRESLTTLGNGIFTTRGAAEEAHADGTHYPATYIAGVFNRLESKVEDKTVSNESIVNMPNYLPITFRCDKGDWFSITESGDNVVSYKLDLDMFNAVLNREMRVTDASGKHFDIKSCRMVSMQSQNPHLAGIRYTITSVDYSGPIQIRSSIDASVENKGIARYEGLASKHLFVEHLGEDKESGGIYVHVTTNKSHVHICEGARTTIFVNGKAHEGKPETTTEKESVHQIFSLDAKEGESITVEKVVVLHTSRDHGILEAKDAAIEQLKYMPSFEEVSTTHSLLWNAIWDIADVQIEGFDNSLDRLQLITRLHIFHLIQTVSANTIGYDVGLPARGLHGEAYRGHVFWDELYIIPFYTLHLPELVKTLLRYRYYRLGAARHAAKDAGFAGAMFPWQSSSDGKEESATVHYNPMDKTWGPDRSALQRHVNLAIAVNVLRFYDTTRDTFFMEKYGAEMIVEICRFWASICTFNKETNRYEIKGVMGPDEFHEKYSDSDRDGVDNNTYTNVMVVWLFKKALHIVSTPVLRDEYRKRVLHMMGITQKELSLWEDISKKMTIIFHKDGKVLSQFQGYEDLQELDFKKYEQKYKDGIERMDRILKSEKDTPDKYKVSKQADVCMLFFLLSIPELESVFEGLQYSFDESMIKANIDYYLPRTTHGSTLSKMIFSYLQQPYDHASAWDMFMDSVRADIDDVQRGTTGEGVHLALMAGSLYTIIRSFAGVDTSQNILEISPDLPKAIKSIKFNLQYRGVVVNVAVSHDEVEANASRNMFPINVQGTIMFAGANPFHKKLHGQPAASHATAQCITCSTDLGEDTNICRICGNSACAKCLVHHIGWSEELKLDVSIKLCGSCSTQLSNENSQIRTQKTTGDLKGLSPEDHVKTCSKRRNHRAGHSHHHKHTSTLHQDTAKSAS